MKTVILSLCLMAAGCYQDYQPVSEEEREANRAALVQRYQEAYPDTWKQELLKYDLELQKSALSAPVYHAPAYQTPQQPIIIEQPAPQSYHVMPFGDGYIINEF
jgi:hypothetical protein